MIGFPPESTNFPSDAVYSACSAVPRRSPCRTVTPPRASAWSSWRAPAADGHGGAPLGEIDSYSREEAHAAAKSKGLLLPRTTVLLGLNITIN